jgi:hypothetical protein
MNRSVVHGSGYGGVRGPIHVPVLECGGGVEFGINEHRAKEVGLEPASVH